MAADDDDGEGLNFRIERSVSAGTYLVQLSGYRGEERGSYTLHVRFTPSSSGGGETPRGDDHGDTRGDATGIALDTNSSVEVTTNGELTRGDTDYFRITLDRPGTLLLHTSGGTDTVGRLEDSGGRELTSNDDGGSGNNFRIERSLSAGTYYVRVRGFGGSTAGSYTLHARFTADQLPGASGDVRVSLTWNADVDLDLYVTNPCAQTLGHSEGITNTCDGFVGEWDRDDRGNGSGSDNRTPRTSYGRTGRRRAAMSSVSLTMTEPFQPTTRSEFSTGLSSGPTQADSIQRTTSSSYGTWPTSISPGVRPLKAPRRPASRRALRHCRGSRDRSACPQSRR